MSVIAFNVAAEAAAKKATDEADVVTVVFDEVEYTVPRPTSAQAALFVSRLRENYGEAILEMIELLLGRDGLQHVRRLIKARRLDLDDLFGATDLNSEGLINQILAGFGGRPTQPSTDSSASQASGGRKSTARARGKGSIPSDSPSTDS